MSQASGGRPKVIGIENRLRQLDADHHSAGETAWSTPSLAKLLEPGGNWPPLRQASSAIVAGSDGLSQDSPLIGMTTIEHATLSLQPSDSFSTSLRTSNSTEPVPSTSVNAASSAAGKAASDGRLGRHVGAVAGLVDRAGRGHERGQPG